MKHFKTITRLMIGIAIMLNLGLQTKPVAADAVTITQQLHVSARVLPMRHIIVDPTGQIVQITSNTTANVKPQVFEQTDAPRNQRPLTRAIYRQYRTVVHDGSANYGILYERKLIPVVDLRTKFSSLVTYSINK